MISPRVKATLRWVLALVILMFLVFGLASRWDELRSGAIEFSGTFLAVCVAWNLIFFLMQAWVWRQCLRFLGHPIDLAEAFYIWSASQVSKYVPGKVMLILVRVGLAQGESVPKAKTIVSIYLELMLMIITSAGVALLLAPAAFASFQQFHYLIFAIIIALGLATLHPIVLPRMVNLGLGILKKEKIEFNIPFQKMFICAVILFAGWLIHGLSAMAAVKAVGAEIPSMWTVLIGFFAAGWLIGFLSFLTPGGLGVREGALAVFLTAFYPLEIAIAISLLSRVAWILAEIAMAGIFWTIHRKSKAVAL
jgi:glycosyltransferase 2 family protein